MRVIRHHRENYNFGDDRLSQKFLCRHSSSFWWNKTVLAPQPAHRLAFAPKGKRACAWPSFSFWPKIHPTTPPPQPYPSLSRSSAIVASSSSDLSLYREKKNRRHPLPHGRGASTTIVLTGSHAALSGHHSCPMGAPVLSSLHRPRSNPRPSSATS